MILFGSAYLASQLALNKLHEKAIEFCVGISKINKNESVKNDSIIKSNANSFASSAKILLFLFGIL